MEYYTIVKILNLNCVNKSLLWLKKEEDKIIYKFNKLKKIWEYV